MKVEDEVKIVAMAKVIKEDEEEEVKEKPAKEEAPKEDGDEQIFLKTFKNMYSQSCWKAISLFIRQLF